MKNGKEMKYNYNNMMYGARVQRLLIFFAFYHIIKHEKSHRRTQS